ncbi:MAG: PmoA family protein [Bacteroidia bacterium]|nr:PmoA family protein [Bacteroidia bacterium]
MKKVLYATITLILSISCLDRSKQEKVSFRNVADGQKVEIFVGEKLFTCYIYPGNLEKQSLYPIISASGKIITRGYPLNPRPFERADAPHQLGLWFNYGNVNGLDFWNNSYLVPADQKSRYGSIKFREILGQNSKSGELKVSSDWVDVNGNILINEETSYVFSGSSNMRSIVRTTLLRAVQTVTFNESKEGMLAIRMDRVFEEPYKKPSKLIDANGVASEALTINNDGLNGVYHNANGAVGTDVWGKRSSWVSLRATKDNEIISITIFDNKQNLNYPGWWHARGYGLFAINNLGGREFDKKTSEVKIVLMPGQMLTFKHKVVIAGDLSDKAINRIASNFK